ncbi:uncharacterized protein [Pseudorasbora parva]|uniref:uncharacterized protein n=1 Tax=Pseudorasbora parva TaxID=51549 RepID=UPI00351F48C2
MERKALILFILFAAASTPSTASTAPEVKTELEFSSNETFTEALSNSTTEEYKNRSNLVTNLLEGVYRPKYANFLRVTVTGFRAGSIVTKTEMFFSLNQTVPSSKDISDTLLTAVANGNLSQLNIIPGSVSVNGTASTTSTATTASIPEVKTELEFSSSETFTEALSNSSTEEYKNRSKLVTNLLEAVYRPKYANFLRVTVTGFRAGSIVTKTQMFFSLNQTVPSSKDISDTLLTAVANGNLSQLNIIPGSVSVNGTASTTSASPTTSAAPTASTATTASIPEVKTELEFSSSETFTEALSNSSTEEYKNRSKLVTNLLEGVYRPKYANFLRVTVTGFRAGSIVTKLQMFFSLNQAVPSSQDIANTLFTAVANGKLSQLNIIPGSVSINGTASATASSGLKIESSLLQATCLIIMTKILTLFQ